MTDAANIREDVFFSRLVSYQTTLNYMLSKVRSIFVYDELPLTVPHRHLERYLTQNGFAVVYEVDGDLFASDSKPSSDADMYGDDTTVWIDHKKDGNTERLKRTIGVDAVLVRNDPDQIGLEPLLNEYSALMAQAKITMLRNLVDLRGNYIIQAKDESAYESALRYENSIRNGDVAVILAEEFDSMEGLVVHSTPISNSPATQTIELTQYINALYYSELGITLNNNMKREYVSSAELEKSTGSALVSVMLEERRLACRDIEALFGVSIDVRISDNWNDDQEVDSEEPASGAEAKDAVGAADVAGPGADGAADSAEEDQPDQEDQPEDGTDAEEATEPEAVTAEEVKDATEAMLGEEVEDDATTEDDPAADDGDPED